MGVKISNLPAIVTPALSDTFPVVQGNVTYKETGTQLSTLFATAGANANITSFTGITGVIQAPTFINDVNGNHVLGFAIGSASAVNYITLINESTGLTPEITSQGADTNVNMTLRSKGTGYIRLISTAVTTPFLINNGTASQHLTSFAFANTAASRVVTFPDATGTVPFTGTLVAGNVVKASTAFNIVDAGFAVLANTTAVYGGGGVSNAFAATGLGATSIVTAVILTSTNVAAIAKAVPTANTLTITFTTDPGAATTVSWIAITPAV